MSEQDLLNALLAELRTTNALLRAANQALTAWAGVPKRSAMPVDTFVDIFFGKRDSQTDQPQITERLDLSIKALDEQALCQALKALAGQPGEPFGSLRKDGLPVSVAHAGGKADWGKEAT